MKKKLLALLLCVSIISTGCGGSKNNKKKADINVTTDPYGQTVMSKGDTFATKVPARIYYDDTYIDLTDYGILENSNQPHDYVQFITMTFSCDKISADDFIDFVKTDPDISAQVSNDKTDEIISYSPVYTEYDQEKKTWLVYLASREATDEDSMHTNKSISKYNNFFFSISYDDSMQNGKNIMCDIDAPKAPVEFDVFEEGLHEAWLCMRHVSRSYDSLDTMSVFDGYFLDGDTLEYKVENKSIEEDTETDEDY